MSNGTTFTPNYGLSDSTRKAVREAGVGGEKGMDARKHLKKTQIADAITGGVDELGHAVDDFANQKLAEQQKLDEADINWQSNFGKMDDRMGWASPELYDQFNAMEQRFKAQHLAHVESGDKKAASVDLAKQSQRASSLKDWQQTMTTAAKIDKEYGWNIIMEGDDDEAKANREILGALAANDGTAQVVIDPETGEMGFTTGKVDPETGEPEPGAKVWLHRDINDLVAVSTKPIVREEGFQNSSTAAAAAGEAGQPWDANKAMRANKSQLRDELKKNPKASRSILHDAWAGDKTLAEDLLDANVIQGMDFKIKMPKTFGNQARRMDGVIVAEMDVDGDGYITAADLTGGDAGAILAELEKPEHVDLLAEVAADWRTKKEQNIYNESKTAFDNAFSIKQQQVEADKVSKMTKQQRDDYYRIQGRAPSDAPPGDTLAYYSNLVK